MEHAKILMVQGTSSGAGKSTLVIALCRILSDLGFRVCPFKAQNMSSKIFNISKSEVISNIQAVQAIAARNKPSWKINPILLIPVGNYRSRVFIKGKFYAEMTASKYYKDFVLQTGFPMVLQSIKTLRKDNDILIVEGAGSPAEINIAKYDIANMLLAEKTKSPVLLISDIERGGCFASLVGTMELLQRKHQKLVKGFLINKFRGNKGLLKNAIKHVQSVRNMKCLGIIPKIDFSLPEEDSLDGTKSKTDPTNDDNNNSEHFTYSKEILDQQIDILSTEVRKNIELEFILDKVLKLTR